jgi:hypothetical protein
MIGLCAQQLEVSMVSVTGTQHRHESASVAKPAPSETEGTASPGKSGQSVGHLAKAFLLAKADGEDQPANAMGKAAASIAKMTFEQRAALFAPVVEPEPEPDPTTEPETTPDPTAGTDTPADETDTTPDPATEPATPPSDPASDAAVTILAQILADADEADQTV